MYYFGYDVRQDFAEALTWYRKAANQGFATAQYSLGNMYRDGKGVRQSAVEAHKWYSLAAVQGNELAKSGLDILSGGMTQEEISEARKLALDWMVKQGKE
jgi:TPR repeat protein